MAKAMIIPTANREIEYTNAPLREILPEGMGSASLIAAMAGALENLPGGERIKIEKLKFDGQS